MGASSGNGLVKGVVFWTNGLGKGVHFLMEMVLKRGNPSTLWTGKRCGFTF